MPDPILDTKTRAKALMEQFDAFLASDSMRTLLSLLDTDTHDIANKYNARRKADGGVLETQDLNHWTAGKVPLSCQFY